jgi:putative transposase
VRALFGVSRSWHYYQKPSEEHKAREDVALRDAIELLVLEFPGYGYRRVTEASRRRGRTINHKKVPRVMRKGALGCRLKRRFKPTTDSSHSLKRYPNLIKDATLSGPDRGWVAGITYVRPPTSSRYLAAIVDAYSRYRVGRHLSRWIDTPLTLAALERALDSRRAAAGL